jgi:hypothetical protein
MKGKGRLRPSPAMIVACLALFVALGSGTYAAVKLKLKPNQVKAKNIRTGAVTEPKIATNAVTGPKIAANAVTEAKIAAGAVTEPKLGANSVSTGKIADAAVTTGKLANNSITKAKFVASGSTSNTSNYMLGAGACTLDTSIPIPGAQPGDAVAFAVRTAGSIGNLIYVSAGAAAGGGTIGANGNFAVEVCSPVGGANVTAGSITLDWIAVR